MADEETHSLTAFRQLYPVLVDEAGEVIDGKHRLQADPNWKKMKVEGIKTTKDRLIARMVANGCRREIPAKEKKRWVNDLARILEKESVPIGTDPRLQISHPDRRAVVDEMLVAFCSTNP